MPQGFYTDLSVYALELERVVYRNWILAGHVSELAAPGDFKVMKVAGESAIIVRGEDGELRAFANVCRHRGSLVCLEERGQAKAFSCPYHGWKYGLDGSLVAARDMPDGFDKSDYSLKPVAFDVVHGLMFVCFTKAPRSLEGCKRDLAGPMAMFDFPNLKVAADRVYDIPANWKLCIENYQECYHCPTAHPDYARMHTLTLNACPPVACEGTSSILSILPPGPAKWATATVARRCSKSTGPGAATASPSRPCSASSRTMTRAHLISLSERFPSWLWDVATQADKEIIVNNSKGVHSKYYEPGPFSNMEAMEQRYVDWILQELQRE